MSPGFVRLLDGLDDERLVDGWPDLVSRSDTRTVFQTREWLGAWWTAFGRGLLLPLIVEGRAGPALFAPLFADGGMAFLVGSGGSDELDLIGDVATTGALEAVLDAARQLTPGFVGIRMYHVPDDSATGRLLRAAAGRVGLRLFDEGELSLPAIDGPDAPALLTAVADRTSLRRHERGLQRLGSVQVEHLRDADAVLPLLDAFFEQHVDRWAGTGSPSLFVDQAQRTFYRLVTSVGGRSGWLRFTRVLVDARPVAMHLGFAHDGTFSWYKPTFAIDLSRHSPGEVLLRHLFLAARDEGVRRFDFGIGDEPFKLRFATRVRTVRTWGLYPPEAGHDAATAEAA